MNMKGSKGWYKSPAAAKLKSRVRATKISRFEGVKAVSIRLDKEAARKLALYLISMSEDSETGNEVILTVHQGDKAISVLARRLKRKIS